ncbi:hypothetical protein CSA56_02220 [candidate division KSB3 bacterium]|uniref:4Fe-4S ferredoxin-type domain-containing protein n=1 Tax=candidate division KSB3 bacterium TaxID=2044937 RepID=A0A2G6KJR6_9BACT|nr:MAG: hypothetical protein CSA56_02220 [candidate division KSB3 bacterium]
MFSTHPPGPDIRTVIQAPYRVSKVSVEDPNHLLLKDGKNVANRLKGPWGTSIAEIGRCTECGQCEAACTQHVPVLKP